MEKNLEDGLETVRMHGDYYLATMWTNSGARGFPSQRSRTPLRKSAKPGLMIFEYTGKDEVDDYIDRSMRPSISPRRLLSKGWGLSTASARLTKGRSQSRGSAWDGRSSNQVYAGYTRSTFGSAISCERQRTLFQEYSLSWQKPRDKPRQYLNHCSSV